MLLSEVTNPTRIAPVDAPVYGYHGPRKTILVTDDDPITRMLVKLLLEKEQFEVLEATNGQQAVEIAARERPDLVMIDLHMPQMDGFEFVTRLRASETGKTMPVIVWTVKDVEAEERQRLEALQASVISKRLGGPESLIEQLRRFQA